MAPRGHQNNGPSIQRVRAAYWALVQSQPRRERWAKLNIVKQGAKVFLPYVRETHGPQLTPMFPSYLFVEISGPWYWLKSTFGVASVITNRGRPAEVPRTFVEELLRRHEEDGCIDMSPPLHQPATQEQITVRTGLFKGQQAVYLGRNAQGRRRALIDFLGNFYELSLRDHQIGPPDEPQ